MIYNQLVNKVKNMSGVAGSSITDVTNTSAHILSLICEWVKSAWIDIQTMPELQAKFSYKVNQEFTLDSKLSTYLYTYDDLDLDSEIRFDFNTLYYKNNDQYVKLNKLDHDTIYIEQDVASTPEAFLPISVNSFYLYPTNKDDLNIKINYWDTPQELINNTDTPTDLPSYLHDIIVFKALIDYAIYDSAPEILSYAQTEYQKYLKRVYHYFNVHTQPTVMKFNQIV